MDIQRKMDLYRAMFYCNAESDRDANFIKAESLRIELIAGGLNWKQQEYIMDRLQPNAFFEVRNTNNPSTHTILGNYQPTSETPFKWRWTGGPVVA